jgi:chromosome segregation ATPase
VTITVPKVDQKSRGEDAPSMVKRRRRKAQAAKAAADTARAGVAELDIRIKTNAAQSRADERALRRAQEEIARLKKAIKAAAKDHARLCSARDKARKDAAKAQRKAGSADAKYDQAVLAEIVRREKERDLATATRDKSTGKTPQSARTGAGNATGQIPPPETPDLGTATATRTAARKTEAAGQGK